MHVAVLDAQMPQLGGLQVVKLMQELLKTDAPPAILLANQMTESPASRGVGMHVFTVLGKPVDFNVCSTRSPACCGDYHESRWPE